MVGFFRSSSRGVLRLLHAPSLFLSSAGFNLIMNVVMFVSLGLFFGLVLGRGRLWIGAALLPLFSAAIEGVQFFLPWRGTQAADFVGNSVGAWVGLGLAWAVIGLVNRAGRGR